MPPPPTIYCLSLAGAMKRGHDLPAGRAAHDAPPLVQPPPPPAPDMARPRFYTALQRMAIVMAVAIAAHESGCVLPSIAEGVVLDTTVLAGAQLILETCMLFQGLAPSSEGGAWLSAHNAHRDIQNWFDHWLAHGSVGSVYHVPHAPVHDIPGALLDLCIESIKARIFWATAHDVSDDDFIVAVMRAWGVSFEYLWGRMRAHDPLVSRCIVLEPQPVLQDVYYALRVQYCERMLAVCRSPTQLRNVVWIDPMHNRIRTQHPSHCTWLRRVWRPYPGLKCTKHATDASRTRPSTRATLIAQAWLLSL